jgi:hypothetical protein
MLQSFCARVRPWIAMAAAYALAIQMVLSAFVPSFAPAVAGDAFSVVCQSGHSDSRDGGGNASLRQTPGICCTLVYGSPAILGPDQVALAALEAPVSHVVRPCDEHILAHFFPVADILAALREPSWPVDPLMWGIDQPRENVDRVR